MADFYGTLAMAFRDYRGRSARVDLVLHSAVSEADLATQASSISAAIGACSNAFVPSTTGLVFFKSGTPTWGTAAQYADCGQKLRIVGLDATGRTHALSVPAPLVSDFLADQTTMNPADTNVSPLITLLNAHWVSDDEAKSPITVVEGAFQDRRRKDKIGKWSRTPAAGPIGP